MTTAKPSFYETQLPEALRPLYRAAENAANNYGSGSAQHRKALRAFERARAKAVRP